MEESWEVCVAHMELVTQTIGSVIAQGAASGEFEAPDLQLSAMCACNGHDALFPSPDDRPMRDKARPRPSTR